jgi:hypothetical protein
MRETGVYFANTGIKRAIVSIENYSCGLKMASRFWIDIGLVILQ